jgi:hypothetical protein
MAQIIMDHGVSGCLAVGWHQIKSEVPVEIRSFHHNHW